MLFSDDGFMLIEDNDLMYVLSLETGEIVVYGDYTYDELPLAFYMDDEDWFVLTATQVIQLDSYNMETIEVPL